jgi:hypothetical protein
MCMSQTIDEAKDYARNADQLAIFREAWKGIGERLVNQDGDLFIMRLDSTKTPYIPTVQDSEATDWTVEYMDEFQERHNIPAAKSTDTEAFV